MMMMGRRTGRGRRRANERRGAAVGGPRHVSGIKTGSARDRAGAVYQPGDLLLAGHSGRGAARHKLFSAG